MGLLLYLPLLPFNGRKAMERYTYSPMETMTVKMRELTSSWFQLTMLVKTYYYPYLLNSLVLRVLLLVKAVT